MFEEQEYRTTWDQNSLASSENVYRTHPSRKTLQISYAKSDRRLYLDFWKKISAKSLGLYIRLICCRLTLKVLKHFIEKNLKFRIDYRRHFLGSLKFLTFEARTEVCFVKARVRSFAFKKFILFKYISYTLGYYFPTFKIYKTIDFKSVGLDFFLSAISFIVNKARFHRCMLRKKIFLNISTHYSIFRMETTGYKKVLQRVN